MGAEPIPTGRREVISPDDFDLWSGERWVDVWSCVPILEPASGSVAALVKEALAPESHVDFPKLTEICERAAAEPAELNTAVMDLVQTLQDQHFPMRKKLKALTIVNEMCYDESAVAMLAQVQGLQEGLQKLRNVRDSDLGTQGDENVRMLATEIEKNCFFGGQPPQGGGTRQARAQRLMAGNLMQLGSAAGSVAGSLFQNTLKATTVLRPLAGGVSHAPARLPGEQENNMYFDEASKRWRQKGEPDPPATASASNPVVAQPPPPPPPTSVGPSQPAEVPPPSSGLAMSAADLLCQPPPAVRSGQAPPASSAADLLCKPPAPYKAPSPVPASSPFGNAVPASSPFGTAAATAPFPAANQPAEAVLAPSPFVAATPGSIPQAGTAPFGAVPPPMPSSTPDAASSPFEAVPQPVMAKAPAPWENAAAPWDAPTSSDTPDTASLFS